VGLYAKTPLVTAGLRNNESETVCVVSGYSHIVGATDSGNGKTIKSCQKVGLYVFKTADDKTGLREIAVYSAVTIRRMF